MRQPPSYLLLENVVGFEASDMHGLLLQCLADADYHVAEFILTPLQYGIPYSRPRCVLCAAGLNGTRTVQ
jgi:tRNA (cytosine38-C5)-methyltransferase